MGTERHFLKAFAILNTRLKFPGTTSAETETARERRIGSTSGQEQRGWRLVFQIEAMNFGTLLERANNGSKAQAQPSSELTQGESASPKFHYFITFEDFLWSVRCQVPSRAARYGASDPSGSVVISIP
jgi:hypothetical protein